MPPRNTPAFYAMAVIDQLVLQGDDGWIRRAVVRGSGLADAVYGGANLQGNMFNYQGPMLWTVAANFEQTARAPVIVDSIQAVLDRLAAHPVSDAALRLAQQKARSAYYDILDDLSGFGRADLLASFALFGDHPDAINRLETAINHVTAASVMATARDYLTTSNRTVYVRRPPNIASAGAGR
jgi:predicted Zn-dependent peptidase